MKTYSISEAAKELNLTPYTLRYYDKEGLMPFVERTLSGNRLFKESDISALKIIECLKSTGMPIKEIKNFIDWCSDGDSTLQQRYDMFIDRKAIVEAQIEELKKQWKSSSINAAITSLHWMPERKIFIKLIK